MYNLDFFSVYAGGMVHAVSDTMHEHISHLNMVHSLIFSPSFPAFFTIAFRDTYPSALHFV